MVGGVSSCGAILRPKDKVVKNLGRPSYRFILFLLRFEVYQNICRVIHLSLQVVGEMYFYTKINHVDSAG